MAMSWEEKLEALQSIAPARLQMRRAGLWSVQHDGVRRINASEYGGDRSESVRRYWNWLQGLGSSVDSDAG